MMVMFDLDGVLLDSETHTRAIWGQLLPPDKVTTLWEHCLGVNHLLEQQLFQQTLGWGTTRYHQFLQQVATVAPHHFPLRPGAMELVQHLRALDHKVAIVTSRSSVEMGTVLHPVDWDQLQRHCNLIVTGDLGLASKPDPAPYLFAMRQLPSERYVAVEDSPSGVISATIAGAQVVALEDTVPCPLGLCDKVMATVKLPFANVATAILRQV